MAEKSDDIEKKESASAGFRKMISLKDCVGCKLFSVPLLYMMGLHIGIKNYNNMAEY